MSNEYPRVVMIIQARMGSTRLPGKSMLDLAGATLVGRILERVKRCESVHEIVLAIPDTSENNPLGELAAQYDVSLFRGSENDVLSRYYDASIQFRADYVVRLPADNPVPEPSEIDRIVNYHLKKGSPGFSSNLAEIRGSGYPDGIGAEIFDAFFLKEAIEAKPGIRRQEHVHLNFYDYESDQGVDEEKCPIGTIVCPEDFARPDVILDVNTMPQYLFMKELYEDLYPQNPNFGITEILKWVDEKKEKFQF